jgi:erythromycin esterase
MGLLYSILMFGILVLSGCEYHSEGEAKHPISGLKPVQIEPASADQTPEVSASLGAVIAGASIVAIGESRHDTRDQFLVKADLFKLLVAEFGFRTLIIEESFSHALAIDAYVTKGEGQIRQILSGLAGWYLWDTEEMVALIRWIRENNKSAAINQMIRVLGMDITAPALGVASASAIAHKSDPQGEWLTRDFGDDLHQGDFWPEILQRYRSLDESRRVAIQKNLSELAALMEELRLESPLEFRLDVQLAALQAEIGVRGHGMFSSSSIAEMGSVREHGMKRVVEWIDSEVAGSSGIVIWTHNLHAAKSSFRMPQMGDENFVPMGMLMSESYGANYRAIGGSFGVGSYSPETPPGERRFLRQDPSSMDGAMSQLANSAFLVNLRDLDRSVPVARWLAQEREWRMQDVTAFLTPLTAFDGVYYVDEVSRAKLTPNALARHSGANESH